MSEATVEEKTAPAEAPATDGPPSLEDRVVDQIKTVYDPEIPVNIYDLGLIYDVEVDGANVHIRMTLTSPACPVAGTLPGDVEQRVAAVHGVDECEVELVWDPVWNPEMMTEEAKLELGFF
ncbi:MAG: SUF system Fe-S cluster assembly protein [Acidobacteriota bacterium]|nr:SUF system Fe-S cluster assembly protein [Acidobacteriota bacterium]